jgi:MFS family permease
LAPTFLETSFEARKNAVFRHHRPRHTRTLTVALAGLAMSGAFAIDTFLPSFPAIGAEFRVTPARVQQTLSVYLFAFPLMCLFHGTLSDAFGRQPVILVSLVLFAGASLGYLRVGCICMGASSAANLAYNLLLPAGRPALGRAARDGLCRRSRWSRA